MKLPIRKEYFEAIKSGKKVIEWRDAHITFICEETGEHIRKEIVDVRLTKRDELPDELQDSDLFEDDDIIVFELD